MFQDRDTGFSQAASNDISYVREMDTETLVTSSVAGIADVINPGLDSHDFSTWRLREAAPNAVDSSLSRHAVPGWQYPPNTTETTHEIPRYQFHLNWFTLFMPRKKHVNVTIFLPIRFNGLVPVTFLV